MVGGRYSPAFHADAARLMRKPGLASADGRHPARPATDLRSADPPAGRGQGGGTIAACSCLLAPNPKDAVVFDDHSGACSRKGERLRAISRDGQALRRDPKFAVAGLNRGTAHFAKDGAGQAISGTGQATLLGLNDAVAGTPRCKSCACGNDSDRAVADRDQAVKPIRRRSMRSRGACGSGHCPPSGPILAFQRTCCPHRRRRSAPPVDLM